MKFIRTFKAKIELQIKTIACKNLGMSWSYLGQLISAKKKSSKPPPSNFWKFPENSGRHCSGLNRVARPTLYTRPSLPAGHGLAGRYMAQRSGGPSHRPPLFRLISCGRCHGPPLLGAHSGGAWLPGAGLAL